MANEAEQQANYKDVLGCIRLVAHQLGVPTTTAEAIFGRTLEQLGEQQHQDFGFDEAPRVEAALRSFQRHFVCGSE